MATKSKPKAKKRRAMLLMLDAEVFDALSRFTEETGVPKMHFVAQLLADALPQLEALIKAAQDAKKGTPSAALMRALQATLTDAARQADQLALDIGADLKPKRVGKKSAGGTKRARAA